MTQPSDETRLDKRQIARRLNDLYERLMCVEERKQHPACDYCGEQLGGPDVALVREVMDERTALRAALRKVPDPMEWTAGANFPDGVRVSVRQCRWCGVSVKAESDKPETLNQPHPDNGCLALARARALMENGND